MVTYDSNSNLYKVFKRTLAEKRVKRDGRNPATGAFSAGSHTGSVDLTIDVPIVKGVKNISLPDKTKYSKNPNSPDYLTPNFVDRVRQAVNYNSETHNLSTMTIRDEYDNEVTGDYVSEADGFLFFDINGQYFAYYPAIPEGKIFAISEKIYAYAKYRRTVDGRLLASGRCVQDNTLIADADLGLFFPEFTL
jgi:hypothetical protein